MYVILGNLLTMYKIGLAFGIFYGGPRDISRVSSVNRWKKIAILRVSDRKVDDIPVGVSLPWQI